MSTQGSESGGGVTIAGRASAVERRIVSVLFADLVGFTTLSEQLDAEDVATVQDAYFAAVRETVGRYGGVLEKFIGDAAMAVFGVPRARDDDAERAVRAGLALVAAVEQLGARLGVEGEGLRLRVGVNTGEVVHATDGPDAGRVTGDTVNTAARLQTAAEPGRVLVGEETALAVAESIELADAQELALKGKAEPVRAAAVVGVRELRSRELAMGALRAPTIGRDAELATLIEASARVARTGTSERWLVVAPPGVGKTRLVDELVVAATGSAPSLRLGRIRIRPEMGGPFEPLRPFAQVVVEGALAAAPARSDETGGGRPVAGPDARGRLVDLLGAAGLATPRAEVVATELLALGSPASEPGGATPSADRAARFAAWLDGLDALAAERPQLWVVEDVHWAAADLVAFLDEAARRPAPRGRLLVVTARPSFLGLWPAWADADEDGGRHVLHLATLVGADAGSLVRELVGDALPASLVDRIVERSDGNCLFIEELLRTWVGTGALVRDEADPGTNGDENGDRPVRWRLTVAAEEVPLPATVHAIYAAQLDDLPPDARLAARRGSVAGRRFPLGALESLGVPEAAGAVDELRRRALVRGPTDEPLAGPAFSYRHALLRDAGYASLARAERAELHVGLARWLEAAAGDRSDAVAATIGDHLANAVAAAPVLASEIAPGLDRGTAGREAARWLERAGRRAQGEGALAGAADLFRRAVALTPTDAPADRARRLTSLGRASAPIGEIDDAANAYRDAIEASRAARAAGDPGWRELLADAVWALGALLFERIRFVEAWDLGEAALSEIGDADDLPAARVRLARSKGRAGETNDARGWVEDAERAVVGARAAGDADAEYDFERDLTAARSEAGLSTADDWVRLRELAVARGDALTEVSARINEAAYRTMEEPAASAAILAPAREIAVARGFVERLGWVEHAEAEAALATGDWERAVASGLAAVSIGERHGYDRIAVRSWTALLPAASLRGETAVLRRAARWFDERRGRLPDSPYGRVLHGGCGLWIADGLAGVGAAAADESIQPVEPAEPFEIDHIRPAFGQWIAQGGFEWFAVCDAIVDAWFAARQPDWIRELVTAARAPDVGGDPSPAAPALLDLVALRLDAATGAASRDDVRARGAAILAVLRRLGAPFWIARTLRVLEAFGAATDDEVRERGAIERSLGVVRPTLRPWARPPA